ncbi:MAG: quinone-dependent dihydroorotate dehydrogenase [Leptolyngbyaceae bacterium]|nr:quinone-dependent dihydroorotate dehydrogenase [Leptolyngbyaceae bacterium]
MDIYSLDIYQVAIRPLLFSALKTDPEWAHQQALQFLSWLDQTSQSPPTRWLCAQLNHSCGLADARLEQTLWSLTFKNPVGLAAGFDKDGVGAGIWSNLGFGFAELGTVTFHAQPGNPQPRLFRLLLDQAVLNRMGFNNQGAAALAETLKNRLGEGREPSKIPLGINLGKSKITPLEAAVSDYVGSFQLLQAWGDYFVVNVSSPNTPGLRSLQATDQLEPILAALQALNQPPKPLLIKIAPDLEWEEIAAIVALAQTYDLAGIIATNTTIRRDHLKTLAISATGKSVQEEAGGMSGAPLRERSTEVIRFIWQQTQGTLPIIGVGGIFTAEDAWEKITAGASLLQVYTGWVYEGPWMIRRILQGLVAKLEERGFSTLTEAVGTSNQ